MFYGNSHLEVEHARTHQMGVRSTGDRVATIYQPLLQQILAIALTYMPQPPETVLYPVGVVPRISPVCLSGGG